MFFQQTNKQILDTEYQNSAKQLCLNHDAVVVALDLVRECPVRACVCSAERGEEKEACGCFDEAQAICSTTSEEILTVARWTQQPVFPNLSLALGNVLRQCSAHWCVFTDICPVQQLSFWHNKNKGRCG